jgi:plasmid stabilization system protein ParE
VKIIWSPLAVEGLENIYDYISRDNITAAEKTVESILMKVEKLSKFFERGRKVPEAKRDDIREIFEGEYRIIYRIETKRIVILTIRNFKQLLPDKDLG